MRRLKRIYMVASLAAVATVALALPATASATHPGHVFVAEVQQLQGNFAGIHIVLGGADDPATPDDAAPPKAQTIRILVDKAVKTSFKGLTPCTADFETLTVAELKTQCSKSIVGSGNVTALVGPLPVSGTLDAYIGTGGSLTLVVEVNAGGTPVKQIIPASFQPSSDPAFGTEVVINVPTLAGGAGSLTSADITLSKVAKKGKSADGATASKKKKKKVSLFTATCPSSNAYQFMNIETYSDHETITESFTDPC